LDKVADSDKKRVQYIDRLRGLAVVGMFFVHPAVAWMTPAAKKTAYYAWAMRVSGMVAPVFLFLAGVSVALIAAKGRAKGIPERNSVRRVSKRGLEIVLIGYAFHISTYLLNGCGGSWTKMLKVDVLQCIGLSLALFPWIAWPKRAFNPAALLLFALMPIAAMLTHRLPIVETLHTGIAQYLTTRAKPAQFPFIPYSTWIALGLFIGPMWAAALRSKKNALAFWCGLVLLAVAFYVAGKGIEWIYYHYNLEEMGAYEPQTRGLAHAFWLKGAFVLGLFVLSRATAFLLDRFPKDVFILFGKTSLFSYVAHLIVIYHVAGPFLARKLNGVQHAVASLVLSGAMFLLAIAWVRLKARKRHWREMRARFG
jgi:uncharacterized membrane protein